MTKFSKGVSPLQRARNKNRGKVNDVSYRLGTPKMPKPEWLIATPKDKLPQPERLAFPPTSKEGIYQIYTLNVDYNSIICIYTEKNKETFSLKNVSSNEASRKRSIDQNGS